MYCTQCGNQLPEEAQFCSRCGAPTVNMGETDLPRESTDEDKVDSPEAEEIPEKIGRIDRRSPPKISPLTIIFAILGLILILILLHPWHAGQDRPKDFEGSLKKNQSVLETLREPPWAS